MEAVAGPRRARPAQFAAGAYEPAGERRAAFDHELHGDRRRVPAAGGEAAEHRVFRRRLVEMEGLRIELPGEGLDLRRIQLMRTADEALANLQIV